MDDDTIVEKLEAFDRELHSWINEFKEAKPKPKKSLKEMQELFRSKLISDEDPTEMIRKMRDRKC